jgi:hypothetical protein
MKAVICWNLNPIVRLSSGVRETFQSFLHISLVIFYDLLSTVPDNENVGIERIFKNRKLRDIQHDKL